MWLLLFLLFVVGCGACECNECIDHTLRCTHRRHPFPTRKGLPETRDALDRVCRNQNEYYDCLQNFPGAERTAGSPMSADKVNRLDGEYMLSELCTDGMKSRNNYLKQAACINKQKTDVCLSPEFLVILSANEKALSKCSVQNKVTSCVSMMLAMNCGADAGFLYRRLLHIANDGDVLCNSGEDLSEVFSIFKLEENEAARSDSLDPRLGGKDTEDSAEKHLYRRIGEVASNYHSVHNTSGLVGPSTTHYSQHHLEKQFEADNFTLLTYAWKEMKPREDWVLKNLYGITQPFQMKSDIEMHKESSNIKHSTRGICFPLEMNNEQTNINEQCFDQLLEDIVEKEDIVEYREREDIDVNFGDLQDINRYLPESRTEVFTNSVLNSNAFQTFSSNEVSSNVDLVLESKHAGRKDHTEHKEKDSYTDFVDSHGETNSNLKESMTDVLTDISVLNSKTFEAFSLDKTSSKVDPVLESQLAEFTDYDNLQEATDLYQTETITDPSFLSWNKVEAFNPDEKVLNTISESENMKFLDYESGKSKLKDSKYFEDGIVNEQELSKDYEPSFYEKTEIDLESKNSQNSLDTLNLKDDLAEGIALDPLQFDFAYPRFNVLDKSESIDSIRRNIGTVTDSFPYGGNLKENYQTSYGENEYLVEVNPADVEGKYPKPRERLDKERDTLNEIFKRIGEIEVDYPVKYHIGIDDKPENVEAKIEEIFELNQYNAVIDSNEGRFQNDAQNKGENFTWLESDVTFSNKVPDVENYDEEQRECCTLKEEKDSNKYPIIPKSEAYKKHFLQHNDEFSVELLNIEDIGSGFTEDETIESLANLKDSNLKAVFSTEDTNGQELEEEHLETSEDNQQQLDEISSDVIYMDSNSADSSDSAEGDNIQDLNVIQLTSDALTSLEELENQFIRVNVQEYVPIEEKKGKFQDEIREELKFTNVEKFLSSDIENMESDTYEIPAVTFYATKNYEILDEPPKNIKFNDNEGSGFNDGMVSSSFDQLKLAIGASEDTESYRHENIEANVDHASEETDLESKPSQEETEFLDKQPTLIEISDEDIRKYYEQRPRESKNLLVLLTDGESTESDSSEVDYIKELDSSLYSSSDTAGIGITQTELENEPVVKRYLSSDCKLELFKGLDSKSITRNPFDESTEEYKFVSESLDNLKLGSKESVYLTETNLEEPLQKNDLNPSEQFNSVSESPLLSLELGRADSAHLSESGLDFVQKWNYDQPEDHETSKISSDHFIFEVAKESDATKVLEILDSSTHDQYISEDIGLSEEEHSLVTKEYLGEKRTDKAEYSSFAKGTEEPEEVIMTHLDHLLLKDETDHLSGESSITNQEINYEETGTPVNNIQETSTAQMTEENPKCDLHECLQLVSKNLAVETAEQNLDSYRIATNKIKIPTFSQSDFISDSLSSNKVHSSCDSIFALVRENGSQVSISDIKQRIPTLRFFNVPGDATNYACYIQNSQPSYLTV